MAGEGVLLHEFLVYESYWLLPDHHALLFCRSRHLEMHLCEQIIMQAEDFYYFSSLNVTRGELLISLDIFIEMQNYHLDIFETSVHPTLQTQRFCVRHSVSPPNCEAVHMAVTERVYVPPLHHLFIGNWYFISLLAEFSDASHSMNVILNMCKYV